MPNYSMAGVHWMLKKINSPVPRNAENCYLGILANKYTHAAHTATLNVHSKSEPDFENLHDFITV